MRNWKGAECVPGGFSSLKGHCGFLTVVRESPVSEDTSFILVLVAPKGREYPIDIVNASTVTYLMTRTISNILAGVSSLVSSPAVQREVNCPLVARHRSPSTLATEGRAEALAPWSLRLLHLTVAPALETSIKLQTPMLPPYSFLTPLCFGALAFAYPCIFISTL